MARGRLHRRFIAYHAVVIACLVLVAWWIAPRGDHLLVPLLTGAAVAFTLAVGLASTTAFTLGASMSSLARAARDLAAGSNVRPADLRPGGSRTDDELGDLAAALSALSGYYEEALVASRAEERRLHLILDGMSEGVALLTDGRIAFANPAFARLLEVREPVEGRTPLEASRRAAVAEAIEAVGRGEEAGVRDVSLPWGRTLQLRAAPLADGSTVILLLDVTEARSLERMRREFVANASHELRTPVAAIAAVAETLTSSPSMAASDRARFERILVTHAERLGRLVKDLLDLSRAEGQRPAAQRVDVRPPLQSALAAVRDRADAKQIRIDDQVAQDLPAILADDTAIEQVLVNLLDNAVKYTQAGGRITVRASTSDVPPQPMVTLEVEDTGAGIPKEHLPRIFERFYRVDSSRARDVGGTGLGLAIVKHLAQAHGGDVSVTSAVGVGSTFRVTFPRAA